MGFLNICLRQPGFHVIGDFLRWSHKYYGAVPPARPGKTAWRLNVINLFLSLRILPAYPVSMAHMT